MSKLDPTDRCVFVVIVMVVIGLFISVMTGTILEYGTPEKVQIEEQRTKRYDRLIRMLDYSTSQEKEIMMRHIETLIKAADLTEKQVKEIREKSLRKGDGVEAESEREPAEGR